MADINTVEQLMSEHQNEVLYFQVAPADIDIFNKIIEAYDNIAIVSTVEPRTAKLGVWVTADTKPVLLKLIKKMPVRAIPWQEYEENIQGENVREKAGGR